MADLIEMRGTEINTFETVSMETLDGTIVQVKVPKKQTTLEWELAVLDKLQADLLSLQTQVATQEQVVASIQALTK